MSALWTLLEVRAVFRCMYTYFWEDVQLVALIGATNFDSVADLIVIACTHMQRVETLDVCILQMNLKNRYHTIENGEIEKKKNKMLVNCSGFVILDHGKQFGDASRQ
jgi:hypothetical protein